MTGFPRSVMISGLPVFSICRKYSSTRALNRDLDTVSLLCCMTLVRLTGHLPLDCAFSAGLCLAILSLTTFSRHRNPPRHVLAAALALYGGDVEAWRKPMCGGLATKSGPIGPSL